MFPYLFFPAVITAREAGEVLSHSWNNPLLQQPWGREVWSLFWLCKFTYKRYKEKMNGFARHKYQFSNWNIWYHRVTGPIWCPVSSQQSWSKADQMSLWKLQDASLLMHLQSRSSAWVLQMLQDCLCYASTKQFLKNVYIYLLYQLKTVNLLSIAI